MLRFEVWLTQRHSSYFQIRLISRSFVPAHWRPRLRCVWKCVLSSAPFSPASVRQGSLCSYCVCGTMYGGSWSVCLCFCSSLDRHVYTYMNMMKDSYRISKFMSYSCIFKSICLPSWNDPLAFYKSRMSPHITAPDVNSGQATCLWNLFFVTASVN